MLRVAVVGAGITGLIAARALAAKGHRVTVFEKSRGVGGRMATRSAPDDRRFNHGVQYLRAASNGFATVLQEWTAAHVLSEWNGQLARLTSALKVVPVQAPFKRYIAPDGMRAVGQHLARDIDVRVEEPIHHVERSHDAWVLHGPHASNSGAFDRVLLAVPAPQAVAIMGTADPLASELAGVSMSPRWSLMAGLERPSGLPFEAAQVDGSPITWMMKTISEPAGLECWTMHLSAAWSRMHLELDRDAVARELEPEITRVLRGTPLAHLRAHRWRYALASAPLGRACVVDSARGLALAGDWCLGDRVEHAWESGLAAAEVIV